MTDVAGADAARWPRRRMLGLAASAGAAVLAFAAWLILDPSALPAVAYFLANFACGMCHVAM